MARHLPLLIVVLPLLSLRWPFGLIVLLHPLLVLGLLILVTPAAILLAIFSTSVLILVI